MSSSATRPAAPHRPWLRRAIVLVALAAVAAVAVGAWYLFGRPAAPAAVGLGALPTSSPAASVAPTTPAEGSAAPATPVASVAVPTTLDGTWVVDPTIGSFDDFSGSFVGYRVQEELVGIGAATAVGRTPDVTGSLVLEGTTITSVEIEADLSTLQSDNSMRDGQLGQQGLETNTFPSATFVLTEPIALDAVPADGQAISATAVGDLTLHGVTQRVEIQLETRLSGGVATVIGSLPVAFGDYGMTAPNSMRVLSIDENGTMEFQLQFRQA